MFSITRLSTSPEVRLETQTMNSILAISTYTTNQSSQLRLLTNFHAKSFRNPERRIHIKSCHRRFQCSIEGRIFWFPSAEWHRHKSLDGYHNRSRHQSEHFAFGTRFGKPRHLHILESHRCLCCTGWGVCSPRQESSRIVERPKDLRCFA